MGTTIDIKEILLALIVFLGVGFLLIGGCEIICINAPHDEHFYLAKSIELNGHWKYSTIKEIATPIFFSLVNSLGVPLRIAFSLVYAFSAFVLWRELRHWPFPPVVAWIAGLFPLFIPAQVYVFSRALSDPLEVALMLILLAACLALYRRGGDRWSVLFAGSVAAILWLDRPEGILAIIPPVFTIFLQAARTRSRSRESARARDRDNANVKNKAGSPFALLFQCDKKHIVSLVLVFLPLAISYLGICTFNRVNYGIFAPTVMSAPAFQHSLKQLMSIDDGEPYMRCRPVSKKAIELAIAESPSMSLTREFWGLNQNGLGWSTISPADQYYLNRYIPQDGSISGTVFQWALLDALAFVAGDSDRDRLKLSRRIGDELKTAMKENKLASRLVLSPALGPEFNPLSREFAVSASIVWFASVAGSGPIVSPVDNASPEEIAFFDNVCNRSANKSVVKESRWRRVREAAQVLSNSMVFACNLAVICLLFIAFKMIRTKKQEIVESSEDSNLSDSQFDHQFDPCARSYSQVVIFTLIASSIVFPRIFLLAAIDSNMFCSLEPRYTMPATVILWVWIPLVLAFVSSIILEALVSQKPTSGR